MHFIILNYKIYILTTMMYTSQTHSRVQTSSASMNNFSRFANFIISSMFCRVSTWPETEQHTHVTLVVQVKQ